MFLVYFIAMASNVNPSLSEDNSSGMDLSNFLTEDEEWLDTTNWTPAKRKKLQHMKEFHEEYQCVFGKKNFHLDYNEKQNFSHEPPYARICLQRGDAKCNT